MILINKSDKRNCSYNQINKDYNLFNKRDHKLNSKGNIEVNKIAQRTKILTHLYYNKINQILLMFIIQ